MAVKIDRLPSKTYSIALIIYKISIRSKENDILLHEHKEWTRESGTRATYPVLSLGGVTHENKEVKYLHEESERIYCDNKGAVGMNEWQAIEYPQHAIHR